MFCFSSKTPNTREIILIWHVLQIREILDTRWKGRRYKNDWFVSLTCRDSPISPSSLLVWSCCMARMNVRVHCVNYMCVIPEEQMSEKAKERSKWRGGRERENKHMLNCGGSDVKRLVANCCCWLVGHVNSKCQQQMLCRRCSTAANKKGFALS